MKMIKFFVIGVLFGIVLIKAEVVSWFRIQEMFHFQSFHMYGIIGCAVGVGVVTVALVKRFGLKSFAGETLNLTPKPFNKVGNLVGGILFGLGWALTGACPGPLYALLGAGYGAILVPIVAALLGVIVYGILKPRLPH
jgi:uncharacterized membrane protein YedE/YeeE